jgi:hypothetical protein
MMATTYRQYVANTYWDMLGKVLLVAWVFAPTKEQELFKFQDYEMNQLTIGHINVWVRDLLAKGVEGGRFRLPPLGETTQFRLTVDRRALYRYPMTISGTSTTTSKEGGVESKPVEYVLERYTSSDGASAVDTLTRPNYLNFPDRENERWVLENTTGTHVTSKTHEAKTGFHVPHGVIDVVVQSEGDHFVGDLRGNWELDVWASKGKTAVESRLHWSVEPAGEVKVKLRFTDEEFNPIDTAIIFVAEQNGPGGGEIWVEVEVSKEHPDYDDAVIEEIEVKVTSTSDLEGKTVICVETAADSRLFRSQEAISLVTSAVNL